jgi:hypothetical protein
MSFTDRLVLWLHVGFAIFTIGPVMVAIMSTPRYIRKRDVAIVNYLYRTTRLFAVISLTVLIAGLVLADQLHDFSKPWLSISLTLFVVAIALLVLILRDQHRAIAALEEAEEVTADAVARAADEAAGAGKRSESAQPPVAPLTAEELHPHVERGRITSLGGVVSVIWLVILVLMVWNG